MTTMRIGDLARAYGCSTAFIKSLERRGLIPTPARDLNGHRRYTDQDVDRLRALLLRRSVQDRAR